MRFNVARDYALTQLAQFRASGSLDQSCRQALIEPAAQAESHRLTDEFRRTRKQDQGADDLSRIKGKVHTWRGPSDRESVSRDVEKATTLKGTTSKGEMASHELATLTGDSEPYQDTYELTKFQRDGISHVSVTIVGDGGVGCGSIISMAEFLSAEPGKSWRERTSTDFLSHDLVSLYQRGTYIPAVIS